MSLQKDKDVCTEETASSCDWLAFDLVALWCLIQNQVLHISKIVDGENTKYTAK